MSIISNGRKHTIEMGFICDLTIKLELRQKTIFYKKNHIIKIKIRLKQLQMILFSYETQYLTANTFNFNLSK